MKSIGKAEDDDDDNDDDEKQLLLLESVPRISWQISQKNEIRLGKIIN